MTPPLSRALCTLLGLAAGLLPAARAGARPATLALAHQRLELPGVPVVTLAVDVDRDGHRDLAVVVASTSWGEVGFEEPMQVDDEGTFVDVLTVVPTLLDRRELLLYLGEAGGFAAAPLVLPLPLSVHAVAAGPPAAPLVAWTDDGVAEIALVLPAESADRELQLLPRIAAPTIFAGSESFLARAGLVEDLDGDGDLDLLVPRPDGLAVHLATLDRIEPDPAELLARPLLEAEPNEAREEGGEPRVRLRGTESELPVPQALDLNGDRLPDLLYRFRGRRDAGVRVRLGLGGGHFGPAFDPLPGWSAPFGPASRAASGDGQAATREVGWFGDLDGDGDAEVLTSEEIPAEKKSMRAELATAKRPRARIRVHALGRDGRWDPSPLAQFVVEGYLFEGADESDASDDGAGFRLALPAGVRDLDGDGKLDLVALALDFSLFEAMRVLTTSSLKLGLDFGIYRQGTGFAFRPVPHLDLAGELRLRLDSLALGQISSFAGDFDGDGRADFVQMGRGRKVTIHRGQPGALYAPKPDLAITLEREPLDLALVAVADLDGDGRSDLSVTQPIGGKAIGARAALDLYLSGGGR